MGINYSLCALLERQRSGTFLTRFAELLDVESRTRLTKLEWSPESEVERLTLIGTTEIDARGIAGVERDPDDQDNGYCFSLRVQLEPEMGEQLRDVLDCFEAPGSFGCMWTSVLAGSKYLLIRSTAASSSMSRVLRDSAVIHGMWREFAEDVGAVVAYVDLEDEAPLRLYPGSGELILPDVDTLAFADDHHYSIDRMAEYICRINGFEPAIL